MIITLILLVMLGLLCDSPKDNDGDSRKIATCSSNGGKVRKVKLVDLTASVKAGHASC